MKRLLALVLLLATPAHAADYMITLNDNEKQALLEILDEATKAKGLALAHNTLHFAAKLRAAPVVTERKDDPPKPAQPEGEAKP